MALSRYQLKLVPRRKVFPTRAKLRYRYITDNLLPVGLAPGPKAPKDLDSFIAPFLDELKLLQDGVPAYDVHTDSQFLLKAHLVLVTGDTPAISKLFQFSGHNAKRPCRACKLKGSPFVVNYTTMKDNEPKTGKKTLYYYPPRRGTSLRTYETYLQDGRASLANPDCATESGVKGISPFSELSAISIPNCIPFDVMHLVYLGFVRDLCTLFNGSYRGGSIQVDGIQMSTQAWKELGADMAKIEAPVAWGRFLKIVIVLI